MNIIKQQTIFCNQCGSKFQEDDMAFYQETGLCQYCHCELYKYKDFVHQLQQIKTIKQQTK